MLINDHWYIACPASKLDQEKPLSFEVGPLKYVAFRDSIGKPHLLLDRCCHRGVQLSKGRLTDDCLACGYHGWQYNGAGRVVHIPALGPDKPLPNFSIPSFHVVEKDFYIWIWIVGESEAPTYEPGVRGLVPGNWLQQSNVWQTNIVAAVENQLDNAHTPFSHPGIYPGHDSEVGQVPSLRPVETECFSTSINVSVFWPRRTAVEQPVPSPEDPFASFGLFELPYKNTVFLAGGTTRAIYHWIPLSEGQCRLEFMAYTAQDQAPPTDDVNVMYLAEELEILKQDRELLESAQYWRDTSSECSIAEDLAPMMARKLINAVSKGADLTNFNEQNTRKVYESYF